MFSYNVELIASVHQGPTFLPAEENVKSVRSILCVAGAITVTHLTLLAFIKWRASATHGKRGSIDNSEKKSLADWKASYQLTNLLVNLTLGCLGIYHQITTVPRGESAEAKIIGYEDMKIFATSQVGYQLWALPVGLFFVEESQSMLMHHVAVICVGSVSAFVTSGFRYYIPYFYGVIEISSVPLSIMNSFKNNPDWIKTHPKIYNNIRLVFGVTFLLVRALLWTPIYWDFFSLATTLLFSSKNALPMAILSIFVLSSLILSFLQYFWASKIISALLKGAGKKKSNTKHKKLT